MRRLTARGLTVRYLAALGLVAFLSIALHFVVKDMLHASEGSAELMNISGRQRMLSQRIVSLALELDKGDETARAPMKKAIEEFGAAHRRLVRVAGADIKDSVGETRLRDTYFGAAGVDRAVQAYLAAAGRIAEGHEARAGPEAAQYAADMAFLVSSARGPMLEGLEQVVTIHQTVSEEHIRLMQLIQQGIVIVIVLTLQIEALFIFRPMVKSISGYVRQLLELADRDYLTGVTNRRAFTDLARTEIQRARRYKRSLSILLIDVDHFKRINDTHGHLAGDAVLTAIARTLENSARREDVVGRIGGEEFAILLPETPVAEAREVAERLRRAMASHPIEAHGKSIEVTVSIGLASVPLDVADPLTAAMGTADSMLYKAKEAGRNCVWPKLTQVDTDGGVRNLRG